MDRNLSVGFMFAEREQRIQIPYFNLNYNTIEQISVVPSQLFIFSELCIQTSVTIYGSAGSCAGEVYDTSCFRVYCTGSLYHLNQEVKFLYKKK